MKPAERIIPFTKKEKRRLRRMMYKLLFINILYVSAVLMLGMAVLFSYRNPSYKLLTVAAIACFALLLIMWLFKKFDARSLRLLRDLHLGKKRVIHGRVEHVSLRQNGRRFPEQVYDVGPYRFELGQLSPALRRFKEVMPGQVIEVHQCLHSGIVLGLEVVQ